VVWQLFSPVQRVKMVDPAAGIDSDAASHAVLQPEPSPTAPAEIFRTKIEKLRQVGLEYNHLAPHLRKYGPTIKDHGLEAVLEYDRRVAKAESDGEAFEQELANYAAQVPISLRPDGSTDLEPGAILLDNSGRGNEIYRFVEEDPNSYVARHSLPGYYIELSRLATATETRPNPTKFKEAILQGKIMRLVPPPAEMENTGESSPSSSVKGMSKLGFMGLFAGLGVASGLGALAVHFWPVIKPALATVSPVGWLGISVLGFYFSVLLIGHFWFKSHPTIKGQDYSVPEEKKVSSENPDVVDITWGGFSEQVFMSKGEWDGNEEVCEAIGIPAKNLQTIFCILRRLSCAQFPLS